MACDSLVSSAKLRLEFLRVGRSMEAIEYYHYGLVWSL